LKGRKYYLKILNTKIYLKKLRFQENSYIVMISLSLLKKRFLQMKEILDFKRIKDELIKVSKE